MMLLPRTVICFVFLSLLLSDNCECRGTTTTTTRGEGGEETAVCDLNGNCNTQSLAQSTAAAAACGLYSAPSTVEESGWGVFAGSDVIKGTVVEPLLVDDIGILLIDMDEQQSMLRKEIINVPWRDTLVSKVLVRPTESLTAGSYMYGADQVQLLAPGLYGMAKRHSIHYNLQPLGFRNQTQVSRTNPAVGVSTHLQQLVYIATRNIQVGEELIIQQLDDEGEAHGKTMPTTIYRRTLEELQSQATCLDHIQTKQSTLSTPTNGAFARRRLNQDQTIAPVPLLALSKEHLKYRVWSTYLQKAIAQTHQLLLNYCYSHPLSSLVLFPYGMGINLVNHHRSQDKVNVALRWSSQQRSVHHNMTVQELLEQQPALSMELYALRDIEPGEELFLYYGDNWQRAWEKHVDAFIPVIRAATYQPADEYTWKEGMIRTSHNNDDDDDDDDDEEDEEDDEESLPAHIQTRCNINNDKLSRMKVQQGWYEWSVGGDVDDSTQRTVSWEQQSMPCVVESVDGSVVNKAKGTLYRVTVTNETTRESYKVKNVPATAILLVDKPYTSNQYLLQSFRHAIELPNEVWPDTWKDLVDNTVECGLYMAESSIPHSGLGMYTAVNITKDDRIFYGDLLVQVEDYEENSDLRRRYHEARNIPLNDTTPAGKWLLNAYFWNSDVMMAVYEAHDIQSIFPGLGMLANSHTGLVNAHVIPPHTTADLHRAKHAGSGASTSYHDGHYLARKNIQAGEEIFVEYGDNWFKERADLGKIPLSNDFTRGDSILHRFWKIIKRDMTGEFASDLWKLVESTAQYKDRLAAALPPLEDVPAVIKSGTAAYSTPNRIRSHEWFKENGLCLDNIKPGDSTIRGAGKGAFATRRITIGQLIAPMPVVNILRRDVDVYEPFADKSVHHVGLQQIINYCYGHPDSSVLLFPYSPVVNYINHNQTKANVKIQWSRLPNHRKDWLERTPEDIAAEAHAGLIMELVATRDIHPGEEIFLDYGDGWEKAWTEHVRKWRPPPGADGFVPAAKLNSQMEWLRTASDLIETPRVYSNHEVLTVCFVGKRRVLSPEQNEDFEDEQYVWRHESEIENDNGNMYPCDILDVETADEVTLDDALDRSASIKPTELTYTVRLGDDDDEDDDDDEGTIFVGVPRSAIKFFDAAYSSDMFIRSNFRHEIMLPNEMVTQSFRDMASS